MQICRRNLSERLSDNLFVLFERSILGGHHNSISLFTCNDIWREQVTIWSVQWCADICASLGIQSDKVDERTVENTGGQNIQQRHQIHQPGIIHGASSDHFVPFSIDGYDIQLESRS